MPNDKIDSLTLPDGQGVSRTYDFDLPPDATINVSSIESSSIGSRLTSAIRNLFNFNSPLTDNGMGDIGVDATWIASLATQSDLSTVREIAEGKTNSYVVNSSTFNSQAATITLTSDVTDIGGNTIALSDLKVGDVFYVTTENVPDRWVGAVTSSSVTLYKLETVKPTVTDVWVNGSSVLDNTIAKITVPTITLNGSATTTPSFYAPTAAGSNNQILKSNGSGAPSWVNQSTLSVGYASSAGAVDWANINGHDAGVDADLGITSGGTTFLRKDGNWVMPPNTTYSFQSGVNGSFEYKDSNQSEYTAVSVYSLPVATSGALGGIKIGWTGTGKNYAVLLNSSNQAYVNVPWISYSVFSSEDAGLVPAYDEDVGYVLKTSGWSTLTSSDITNFTTAATTAARGAISGTSPISYNSTSGAISLTLASNSGLENSSGLKIKIIQGGGLNLDASGLSIENPLPIHTAGEGSYLTWNGSMVAWGNLPAASTSQAGIIQIGSAATQAAPGNHTHAFTIAFPSSSETTTDYTLAASTRYKITVGGTSKIIQTAPNTTYTANNGIILSGTTFGHSNSAIDAANLVFKKISYNAYGHIVGTADVTANDLPSHTHAYTQLTGSGTTANQAIVSNGTANGWTLKTLGSAAFTSTYTGTAPINISNANAISLDFAPDLTSGQDGLTHANTITSGTAGEGGSTRTLTFGGTFNVPSVTYDGHGHITSKGSITLTMPANPDTNTTYSLNVDGTGTNAGKVGLVSANPASTTWYVIPYATAAGSTPLATAANQLNSSVDGNPIGAGSSTNPIYFNNGLPIACGFTVETNVPANALFTDTHVKLTSTSTNTNYPLVLGPTSITSGTAYEAYYNSSIKVNPSTGNLQATQLNGVTIGNSPKFTDTTYSLTVGSNTHADQIGLTPTGGSTSWITVPYATHASGANQAEYAQYLNNGDDVLLTVGSATQPVWFNAGVPASCTYSLNKTVPADAKFTDTTYTLTHTNNTNTIILNANGTAQNTITLGANAWNSTAIPTTYLVSASASGNTLTLTPATGSAVTFTPTFTDTNTWREIYVNGTSWKGTALNTGYIDFVQGDGITLAKGTGTGNTNKLTASVNLATTTKVGGIILGFTDSAQDKEYAVQLDSDYNKAYVHVPWTDTTYTANTGIKLNGTTFQHTNSVTAGTASEGGSARTLAFSGTFNIPSVTYDAQGHITGKGSVTLTMPANPDTDTTYSLSGSLSSHTFTSTLTAGGSGSGTSTSAFTLVAGNNITLTDGTSNKITIAATDTTYSVNTPLSLSGTRISLNYGTGLTLDGGNTLIVDDSHFGTAAFTNSNAYATSGHTHTTSIATTTDNVDLNLGYSGKYKLTAGGTSIVFTLPAIYSLPLASNGTRGGIQTGYTTDATNRNYAVQLSSEKAYVNVPWTDTTYSAATAAGSAVSTTAAVGTSTKYAREDHVHNISLATGDSNGQVKIAGTNINVKGLDALAYTANRLFTTNPFADRLGSSTLYISKIDNGLYRAADRYDVTATIGGNAASASAIANLFDGSYESSMQITNGQTAVITIDTTNKPWQGTYPYGTIYLSFYYVCKPTSVSCRIYNTYSAQGAGWHTVTCTKIVDKEAAHIYSIPQDYYQPKKIEITIVGDTTNSYGYTALTQIEMYLSRPDPRYTPFINKYGPETLYSSLTAPEFIEGGTSLTNKYAPKVHTHVWADITKPSGGIPASDLAISGTAPISYNSSTGAISLTLASNGGLENSNGLKIKILAQGSGLTLNSSGLSVENPLPAHISGDGNYLTWNGTMVAWGSLPTASTSAAGIIQIGSGATQAAAGNHTHTNMVTGSGLTSGYFVVGNSNSTVKISSMYPSTSSTTWSTSSDVYVPTMKAISNYVTGLGYTSNTGTVTSVTIKAGVGITVDNAAAITTSGERTISAHAGKGIIVDSNGINVLCDSPLYIDDDDSSKLKLAYSTGLTLTSGGALAVNLGTGASQAAYGNHTHTNMVTGSGLTSSKFVIGNNNSAITISTMQPTTSGTTWSTSSDVYVPTMKAISSYVTGLGYTTNTGTVTSVAASGNNGISISGSPITTSGTITIGLNLSTAINGLGEGTSPAVPDDYIVAQYAGGGTTTTTYHRRKLSNIFAAMRGTANCLYLGQGPNTTPTWIGIGTGLTLSSNNLVIDSSWFEGELDDYLPLTGGTLTNSQTTTGILKINSTASNAEPHVLADFMAPNMTAGSTGSYSSAWFRFGVAADIYKSACLAYHYASTASLSYLGLGLYGIDYVLNINGQRRVGINTTSPISDLDVNGTLAWSSAATSRYNSTDDCIEFAFV